VKDSYTRRELLRYWIDELVPRTLQGNVYVSERFFNAMRAMVRLDGVRLTVILEVEDHVLALGQPGSLWAHLSVGAQNAKPKRVPTWEELGWCKRYFLGDRKAIQVLPPRAEYVNDNPHVLHLFVALERDPLPDFRHRTLEGVLGL